MGKGSTWRVVLWGLLVFLAAWFLWSVRGVLLPFVLAFVIAILLDPVVRRLRLRGVSRPTSVLAISGLFFVVVGVAIVLAVPRMTLQLRDLRGAIQGLTDTITQQEAQSNLFLRWNPTAKAAPPGPFAWVDNVLDQNRSTLERLKLPTTRQAITEQYLEPHRDQLADVVQNFFNGFLGIVTGAASSLLMLLFTPIFAILFLFDMDRIQVRAASWIPPMIRGDTVAIMREVGGVFLNYLRGVTVSISLYTALSAIVLSLMGAPFSVLLALLAGALYLVPIIGAVISTGAVLLVVGFSGQSNLWGIQLPNPWVYAALVVIVFFVVGTLYDTLVNPRIVGGSIGLPPLLSMFVVFAGGALFGVVGMIIAFPLAGSIKVILERLIRVSTTPTADTIHLPSVPLRHRRHGAT